MEFVFGFVVGAVVTVVFPKVYDFVKAKVTTVEDKVEQPKE